jgi:hypothetical protein
VKRAAICTVRANINGEHGQAKNYHLRSRRASSRGNTLANSERPDVRNTVAELSYPFLLRTRNDMKVLVCGGRDYSDAFKVGAALAPLEPSIVIQGGAKGADALAKEWAIKHDIHVWTYLADWETHGRAAGPIRNQWMLENSEPNVVVAFPGGRGTADMVRRAKKAGVRVIEIGA